MVRDAGGTVKAHEWDEMWAECGYTNEPHGFFNGAGASFRRNDDGTVSITRAGLKYLDSSGGRSRPKRGGGSRPPPPVSVPTPQGERHSRPYSVTRRTSPSRRISGCCVPKGAF